jgi:hypothetical protein
VFIFLSTPLQNKNVVFHTKKHLQKYILLLQIMRIIRNNFLHAAIMNFDASHFLLSDTEEEELTDPEDDSSEDDEDDDPFEVSTTNPWEYDDRDDF